MFLLTKNTYIEDGKCWYKDEHNNTVFAKQTEEGFTARLRFNNKKVSMEPINVKIPLEEDEDGAMLDINVSDEFINNNVDVSEGLKNFTNLVQNWINMSYDIKAFGVNGVISGKNEQETVNLYNNSLQKLMIYEELLPTINRILQIG